MKGFHFNLSFIASFSLIYCYTSGFFRLFIRYNSFLLLCSIDQSGNHRLMFFIHLLYNYYWIVLLYLMLNFHVFLVSECFHNLFFSSFCYQCYYLRYILQVFHILLYSEILWISIRWCFIGFFEKLTNLVIAIKTFCQLVFYVASVLYVYGTSHI